MDRQLIESDFTRPGWSIRLVTKLGLFAVGIVVLGGCSSTNTVLEESTSGPIDHLASAETRALFSNLKQVSKTNLLFGHQDDLAYGVNWVAEKGRSDVLESAGAYPSVFGWELGDLENGVDHSLDNVSFKAMQGWIKEGYRKGSVITISWHMDNPVSGGSSWDTTRAVNQILPGGVRHEEFKVYLDRFADFVGGLKVGRLRWMGGGHYIPIVFRAYHEHTGSWFWWGGKNVTAKEYKALWRFTVEYLRDEKGLHNLLYAYSTDVFETEEQYLHYYPGDEYVDLLGFDDYRSLSSDSTISDMTRRAKMLVSMAEARGKLSAITETGLETVSDDDWWTNRLLKSIVSDPVSSRIAYVLVWRNANSAQRKDHHYAPYAGHSSVADFVRFYEDPFVMFADELPNLYK